MALQWLTTLMGWMLILMLPLMGVLGGSDKEQVTTATTTTTQIEDNVNTISNQTIVTTHNVPPSIMPHVDRSDAWMLGLSLKLFVYGYPIVCGIGTTGNFFMFIVMQHHRGSPVSLFMSALAVVDTNYLLSIFVDVWILAAFGVATKSVHPYWCKMQNFIFMSSYTISAWLVVAVCVDRVIVVWYPLYVKQICTVRKAAITTTGIVVSCCGFYLVNFWVWDINPATGLCDTVPAYHGFSLYIYPIVRGFIYSYIPMTCVVILSSAIIVGLARAQATRATMGAELMDSRRITVTVLSICVASVVFSVPTTVFYAILYSRGEFNTFGPMMALVRTSVILWGSFNHAVNFFLYVMTSSKFRAQFRALCRHKNNAPESTKLSDRSVSSGKESINI